MDDEQIAPEEEDGFVSEPAWGRPGVSLDGRYLGQAEDVDAAFALLARAMKDGAYWPNAWFVNERGNTTLVALDPDSGEYEFTDTSYV